MAKNFVKSLVIATVLVTGISTTSARAADDDLAAFLATTIFLFALGSALEGEVNTTPAPQLPTRPGHPGRPVYGQINERHFSNQVPYECLETFTTQTGSVRTFEKSCLYRKYAHYKRLPGNCERTLWTSVGLRYGFDPKCLRNKGFRARR